MALITETNERPDAAIREIIEATIVDAQNEFSPLRFEGEYPDNGVGISIIRPRHVFSDDKWQMTVTTSFANWVAKTFGANNYTIVTGLFNLTLDPQTTEIFPSANGKDLPYQNIENLYAVRDSARGWFAKPYAVRPSNNLTIQAIGRVASTERLGLLGYVLGKRSFLITASP
ncbi:MAG: hypothetical protein Q7R52_02790 [archaeon]|nr:hypothetical protein [archaeon]